MWGRVVWRRGYIAIQGSTTRPGGRYRLTCFLCLVSFFDWRALVADPMPFRRALWLWVDALRGRRAAAGVRIVTPCGGRNGASTFARRPGSSAALTASPNEHEAARAREKFQEFTPGTSSRRRIRVRAHPTSGLSSSRSSNGSFKPRTHGTPRFDGAAHGGNRAAPYPRTRIGCRERNGRSGCVRSRQEAGPLPAAD